MHDHTPIPGSSATTHRTDPAPPQTNRAERLRRLVPIAERQRRVVSRAQLSELGWTADQIAHEIRTDRWHLAAPNVIAMQNAPLVHEQRLWLGVLHAGPDAALSHLTACTSRGLQWKAPDIIEVITQKGHLVAPLDGFFFHQTRRPYRSWTSPGTAAGPPAVGFDIAVLLAAERDPYLRRAIGLLAASVQQRLTTADRLLTASRKIRKLRHGRHFRLALGDVAGGAQSFAEIDIGRLCRDVGLAEPARQRIRKDREGRNRYLDCEWVLADGRIVVLEVDGSFHMQTEAWWRDMRREREIVASGRTVLRCSTTEIRLAPTPILMDLAAVGVPRAGRSAA